MMYCPNCSHEITPDLNFCLNCGSPINRNGEQETVIRPKNPTQKDFIVEPTKSSLKKALAVSVLAVIGVVLIALLFYIIGRESSRPIVANNSAVISESKNPKPADQPPPKSKPQANVATPDSAQTPSSTEALSANRRSANIVANNAPRSANQAGNVRSTRTVVFNNTIVAGANNLGWQSFIVNSGGIVTGRLEGRGGLRGEFEAFILDDDGLTILRNGGSAPTFNNPTGSVVVAKINSSYLNPGLYYIVIRNRSPWTARTVSGTLYLDH